jgi:hydroxymethylbilane synthase
MASIGSKPATFPMTEPGHAQALALRLLADAPEAIRVHFDGGMAGDIA